jgi:hypothetical protein
MKQVRAALISTLTLAIAANSVGAQSPALVIPAGTDILVRANETIDSRTADEGRIYAGTVDQDILDSAGNVPCASAQKPNCLYGRSNRRKSSFWTCSR